MTEICSQMYVGLHVQCPLLYSVRYCTVSTIVECPSLYSVRYSCPILVTFEFSRHIFEIKNTEISNFVKMSGGSQVVQRGQTDRYDEANGRFSNPADEPNTGRSTMHKRPPSQCGAQ